MGRLEGKRAFITGAVAGIGAAAAEAAGGEARSLGMKGDDDGTNPARPVRTGRPAEVAWMAVFLASSESSLVNGAVIPVDSGASAF